MVVIQKKHWDATHNVYAYSLREGGVKRFSDDGEPHGTAGKPILDVIVGNKINDVVIVAFLPIFAGGKSSDLV